MLTQEENELITRTGSGTPMGEFFRRFWIPVMMSEEVAAPDGAPTRLRVLSEDPGRFPGHQRACRDR